METKGVTCKIPLDLHISGKQPMSLQLTSGSGEQTKNEAALWLNQEVENLTLLSYSYCITGTSKPADT